MQNNNDISEEINASQNVTPEITLTSRINRWTSTPGVSWLVAGIVLITALVMHLPEDSIWINALAYTIAAALAFMLWHLYVQHSKLEKDRAHLKDERLKWRTTLSSSNDNDEIKLLQTNVDRLSAKIEQTSISLVVLVLISFFTFGLGYAINSQVAKYTGDEAQKVINVVKNFKMKDSESEGDLGIYNFDTAKNYVEKVAALPPKERATLATEDQIEQATKAIEAYYKSQRYVPWLDNFSAYAWSCSPVLYVIFQVFRRKELERDRHEMEAKIVGMRKSQLQDGMGNDFFSTLVRINFKYLDQYYLQTQEQANKSFKLSLWAAVGGGTIISLVILKILFSDKEIPGAGVYVTTVAGVIGQIISAVFFYLYNKTIKEMGEYHQKLVLTQNIGIALRIADSLPPDIKAQTQKTLVQQLTLNINGHLSGSITTVEQALEVEAAK